MEVNVNGIKYNYGKFSVPVWGRGSSLLELGIKEGIQMLGCSATGRNAVAVGYNTIASGN